MLLRFTLSSSWALYGAINQVAIKRKIVTRFRRKWNMINSCLQPELLPFKPFSFRKQKSHSKLFDELMSTGYIQYVFIPVVMEHRHFNWGLWGWWCWALYKCIWKAWPYLVPCRGAHTTRDWLCIRKFVIYMQESWKQTDMNWWEIN